MPKEDSGGHGDVERVFGAKLGDFEADVGGIDRGLVHAIDLVTHDDGIFFLGIRAKLLERDASLALLHGAYLIATGSEGRDGLESGGIIGPADGVFGAESRFVDLHGGGSRRDATEGQFGHGKGIR